MRLALVTVFVLTASCGPSSRPCTAGSPRWTTDLHPLLKLQCGACHHLAAGGVSPYDGPGRFGQADPMQAWAEVLPYVNAGDAAHSELFLKVSLDPPAKGTRMPPPPGEAWSTASQDLLRSWIDAGACSE